MIYNIPAWPADSNVKHTATTWILARDIDFKNIEEEVNNSTTDLIAWEVDKLIPTGEIWYVKALRKLEDENGNDLNNTNWIGPKPVFSEESNGNDFLAPKFHISTPYIKDIVYNADNYIKIILAPYKTNVSYLNTLLTLTDKNNNLLLSKVFNLVETNNVIEITNSDIDISQIDILKIDLVHRASQSTLSPVTSEIINLKQVFFKIEGDTVDIDPIYKNDVKAVSTTYNNVTILDGSVYSLKDELITSCTVNGNVATIPEVLEFKKEYKLKLNIQYIDDDGKIKTTLKYVTITTKDNDEVSIISSNRVYDGSFAIANKYDKDDGLVLNIDRGFNVEEFFNYIFILPNTSNKLGMFGLDVDSFVINEFKNLNIDMTKNYSIRLITKTIGYIQTLNSSNNIVLTKFTYDPYKDIISLHSPLTASLKSTNGKHMSLVTIPSGTFVVGTTGNNIKVYELNISNNALTEKINFSLDSSISDAIAVELDIDKILIIPKGSSEDRFHVFTPTTNYIASSTVIPTDFRNKNLLLSRLGDGRVIIFKDKESGNNKLDYAIYNFKDESSIVSNVNTNGANKQISNIIRLRNDDILTLVKNVDGNKTYIEYWLYK